MRMKKILALLLSIVMLLSISIIPVGAAIAEPAVSLSEVFPNLPGKTMLWECRRGNLEVDFAYTTAEYARRGTDLMIDLVEAGLGCSPGTAFELSLVNAEWFFRSGSCDRVTTIDEKARTSASDTVFANPSINSYFSLKADKDYTSNTESPNYVISSDNGGLYLDRENSELGIICSEWDGVYVRTSDGEVEYVMAIRGGMARVTLVRDYSTDPASEPVPVPATESESESEPETVTKNILTIPVVILTDKKDEAVTIRLSVQTEDEAVTEAETEAESESKTGSKTIIKTIGEYEISKGISNGDCNDGHTYVITYTASCTEDGPNHNICVVCGEIELGDYGSTTYLGHDYGSSELPEDPSEDMPACIRCGGGAEPSKIWKVEFITNYAIIPPQEVEDGNLAQKPEDPVRTGYTFIGWVEQTSFKRWNFDTPVTRHIVLNAEWITNWVISYNPNGGDGTMEVDYVEHGMEYTMKDNEFIRSNYTFIGWSTHEDDSEELYAPGTVIKNVQKSITLYAQWTLIPEEPEEPDVPDEPEKDDKKKTNTTTGNTIRRRTMPSTIEFETEKTPLAEILQPEVPKILQEQLNNKNLVNDKLINASARIVDKAASVTFDPKNINLAGVKLEQLYAVRFDVNGNITIVKTEVKDGKVVYEADKPGNYIVVDLGRTRLTMRIGSVDYTINGVNKKMDISPELVNNRTMVPARFIVEGIKGTVSWIDVTKTANFELGGKSVSLTIGIIGEGMDTPAYISGNRTMVPLRYVSEMLGCFVSYNADTRVIDIIN